MCLSSKMPIQMTAEEVWGTCRQDQATLEVERGLQADGSTLRKIALLLSGQKLPDAAALASASGHVRLATLVVQVPCPACLPRTPARMRSCH